MSYVWGDKGMSGPVPYVFGRLHSLECHNFHMKRFGRCPYCAAGSKPIPKCVIVEAVNK